MVQNTLGRTSVIYRLKVLPSFITSTDNTAAVDSASGLKVNSTPPYNRSRKSVLDSQHPNDLAVWSTRLANGGKSLKSDSDDSNKPDDTILSLRNVTVERLGQKITLRCYVDGAMAQPHFRVS